MSVSAVLQTTKSLARSFGFSLYATSLQLGRLQQSHSINMSSAKKSKTEQMYQNDNEKRERLLWVDLEMTGLDLEKDRIIEIACIVTTGNLDIIAEGPNIVIHESKEVMDGMNEWCVEHHGQSGLTKAVEESKISTLEAEETVLKFVRRHTEPGWTLLAGNSVYMDKMFLARYMPKLHDRLHYRIVDVSSIKELCRRWYPAEFDSIPKKAMAHRALGDIREAIEELRYYRQAIFKNSGRSMAS